MLKGQFEVRPGRHPQGLMGVFGQYVRAVDYLFDAIERTSFSADHCSYPLLYLMRHALEVGLKANIQCISEDAFKALDRKKLSKHDLSYLIDRFVQVVEDQAVMSPETLEHFHDECNAIRELVTFMPSASSFRYTEERDGSSVFGAEVLDIAKMKALFKRADTILTYTPAVLFG